mmetsp:Transcript_5255/g.18437  ORF Transcript_5255/g.18437 Transcript_5255/m.18437 type:complete len:206 (-) Transcript_5255:635-1252(-)
MSKFVLAFAPLEMMSARSYCLAACSSVSKSPRNTFFLPENLPILASQGLWKLVATLWPETPRYLDFPRLNALLSLLSFATRSGNSITLISATLSSSNCSLPRLSLAPGPLHLSAAMSYALAAFSSSSYPPRYTCFFSTQIEASHRPVSRCWLTPRKLEVSASRAGDALFFLLRGGDPSRGEPADSSSALAAPSEILLPILLTLAA